MDCKYPTGHSFLHQILQKLQCVLRIFCSNRYCKYRIFDIFRHLREPIVPGKTDPVRFHLSLTGFMILKGNLVILFITGCILIRFPVFFLQVSSVTSSRLSK